VLVTTTIETGVAPTFTIAVPDFPSDEAVTSTGPGLMPVTTPVDTVALEFGVAVHETVLSDKTLPDESFSTALSATVLPTRTDAVMGSNTTSVTGTNDTLTLLNPDLPSIVAVISVAPGARPVTAPLLETDAIELLATDQLTVRPLSTPPVALRGVATA
jgi:hypothetical protein